MPTSHEKELVLVLGGAKSGKSRFALQYAEAHYHSYLFLATARILDDEMADRIKLHQASRGEKWQLLEKPLEVSEAIKTECGDIEAILLDCLTVWLSNVLVEKGEEAVQTYQNELLETLANRNNTIIIVSNEVGAGIVPENPLARKYRDLAGGLNQQIAAIADKVILSVAGIPVYIKGDKIGEPF